MILCVAGVTAGLVLGLIRGGRFAHLASSSPRWLPAAAVALIVLAATRSGVGGESGLLVAAALVALVAVSLRNLHMGGTGVIAVGLLVNLVPLVANGGTPVDAAALAEVGIDTIVLDEHLLDSQHLADDHTVAAALSSRIPIRPLGTVVSFGDLIATLGLAALANNLVRQRRRGIPVSEVLAAGPLTLGDWPEPLIDLTSQPVGTARRRDRSEHPVEVSATQPVPVPLGWERADDGTLPPGEASLRPRRSRTHPTMRMAHR
jgi:hypothetical protein